MTHLVFDTKTGKPVIFPEHWGHLEFSKRVQWLLANNYNRLSVRRVDDQTMELPDDSPRDSDLSMAGPDRY